jgi:uncharacterized OsmC-like protein
LWFQNSRSSSSYIGVEKGQYSMNKPYRRRSTASVSLSILLLAALVLAACQPVQPPTPTPEGPQLATGRVDVQLSNQPGRAIVSARGNHFVVDSVPPLEGPNEEINPLDMLLGALATCGLFVAERAAAELGVTLESAASTVQGDFDPAGVRGEPVDPRIQALRVHLALTGPDAEQTGALADNFIRRCPLYTTLVRAIPIEMTVGDEPMGAASEGLATAEVTAQLSNQPGRAIVSARGNHFVIDSVPPLQGPNEERNPLDLLLGALGTCGSFVYERAAQELGLPLTGVTASVEGDFDPRGLSGEPVDPRIQTLRVHLTAQGIDAGQAETLMAQFQARCPIYTTLTLAAPIEVTTSVQ